MDGTGTNRWGGVGIGSARRSPVRQVWTGEASNRGVGKGVAGLLRRDKVLHGQVG